LTIEHRLIDPRFAEFQRRRPDLPQGDLRDLSEKELEILVTEFQRDRISARQGD